MGRVSAMALRVSPFLGVCLFGVKVSFEMGPAWPFLLHPVLPHYWATWALSWAWSCHQGVSAGFAQVCWAVPVTARPPWCLHLFHPSHLAQSPPSLPLCVQLCYSWEQRASPHLVMVSRNPADSLVMLSKYRDRHCVGKDAVIPLKQPGSGPLQLQ